MDRWSKRVLGRLAVSSAGGVAVFPSDGPPYPPFVAWAKRAAPVKGIAPGHVDPSGLRPVARLPRRLGPARSALPLAESLSALSPGAYPCDSCADKPCLTTCPVSAFGPPGSQGGYERRRNAPDTSRGHEGADCMALGCRARRACPIGREYVYDPPQAAFHMEAFLRGLRRRKTDDRADLG